VIFRLRKQNICSTDFRVKQADVQCSRTAANPAVPDIKGTSAGNLDSLVYPWVFLGFVSITWRIISLGWESWYPFLPNSWMINRITTNGRILKQALSHDPPGGIPHWPRLTSLRPQPLFHYKVGHCCTQVFIHDLKPGQPKAVHQKCEDWTCRNQEWKYGLTVKKSTKIWVVYRLIRLKQNMFPWTWAGLPNEKHGRPNIRLNHTCVCIYIHHVYVGYRLDPPNWDVWWFLTATHQ